jgi:RHS repeat-associated protein
MRTRSTLNSAQFLDNTHTTTTRTLRRPPLLVFFSAGMIAAWLGSSVDRAYAQLGGGGGNPVGISPEAGPPFPWEAGIQVTPYSVANVFNGNLLTQIELVEPLDMVGVPFRLVLSHNSADGIGSLSPPQGALYPIGDGWNITFGGCLIYDASHNKAHLVEDDGLMKEFTWNSSTSKWVPQTGVHDTLVRDDMGTSSDPSDDHWIVTRKNQWQRVFNADGLLLEERDSNLQFDGLPTGGAAELFERDSSIGNYINNIRVVPPDYSNAFRWYFEYSSTVSPCTDETSSIGIRAFKCCYGEGCPNENGRNLLLVLDGNCRLKRVEWVGELQSDGGTGTQNARVSLSYDSAGRIATITDKNGETYSYEYDSAGRIYIVTDPAIGSSSATTQRFTYSSYTSGRYKTLYRDRRVKDWTYIFYSWGGLNELWNPSPLSAQKKLFGYDASHNRTSFTNEMSKTWSSTYDSNGNMLTIANHYGQKWAFTYDNTYNNLLTIEPPLNNSGSTDSSKKVEMAYADCLDAPTCSTYADRTHVTSIIQPADGVSGSLSNSAGTTTLAWNHGDGSGGLGSAPGRLDSITDANGVITSFGYQPGFMRMSFDRYEGVVASGYSDYRVSEAFAFACDGRGLWSVGHNSGGMSNHNIVGGDGCNIGLSLAGMPSDHSCEECPPSFQQCLTRSDPDPPNPTDWPLPSTSVSCCGAVKYPTCFYETGSPCGSSCMDYMYRLLRQRWQKASPLSAGDSDYDLSERIDEYQYDDLGRKTSHRTNSSLPVALEFPPTFGPHIDRTFSFTPDANGNLDALTDADGSAADYVYNAANQLTDIWVDSVHIVEYTLWDTGQPHTATYVNGTSTVWEYDDAGRIDVIRHKYGTTNLLTLDYHYTPDGLIDEIAQSDSSGTYTMTFDYDKRGRLIWERGELPPVPTGEDGSGDALPVDLRYTYDQLGNRITKEDAEAGTFVAYTYDVDDTSYEHTRNNRLLKTVTTQGSTTTEIVWYTYTRGGHVKQILKTTEPDADPTPFTLTCFDYDSNQRLWLVRGRELQFGEAGVECETATFAREFRYDGDGRRRYWSRERHPSTLEAQNDNLTGWREYLGDSIYADLEVTIDKETGDAEASATRRYLHAADGSLIGWREGSDWHIVHADHLGSTRLVSTPSAAVGSRLGYSAFGEVLSSAFAGGTSARSRYGYCGGWGYENDALVDDTDPFGAAGLLHVGARYYVPNIGRFVQRDPAGTTTGLNVYTYAANSPLHFVDASGHENIPSLLITSGIFAILAGTYQFAAGANGGTLISPGADNMIEGALWVGSGVTALGGLGLGPTIWVTCGTFLQWVKNLPWSGPP